MYWEKLVTLDQSFKIHQTEKLLNLFIFEITKVRKILIQWD